MPQAAYPADADMLTRFTDAGITPPGSDTRAKALAWAIARWQRRTKWQPFLSDGQQHTYNYDPAAPRQLGRTMLVWKGGAQLLELRQGLISLTSLTIDTTAYTVGTDFWLRPDGAPERGRPYEYIEFGMPVYGQDEGIAITGVWGFALQVPDDAFEDILDGAIQKVMPLIAMRESKGRAKRQQGETVEQYALGKDAGAYSYEIGLLRGDFAAGISSYRRWLIGV